jgi:hypothetical protein
MSLPTDTEDAMKVIRLSDEQHAALKQLVEAEHEAAARGEAHLTGAQREALSVEPLSGFDGVLVTFGDGCDDDTVRNVFGHCAGYTAVIDTDSGRHVEGRLLSVGWDWQIDQTDDEHDWEPTGDVEQLDFGFINHVHIY